MLETLVITLLGAAVVAAAIGSVFPRRRRRTPMKWAADVLSARPFQRRDQYAGASRSGEQAPR
ncbi:hypothetical protein [Rhodococcus opacus]|uniref:hypothetical protein n=1 Tax=Rhodococcus opacus TaxID=37919 RepID=UPI0002D37234|nr:hypothetical protein [Rhodococcus opacus]AHK35304.1 hypothetical protein Pd630_LPD09064 [Rhodococcus opacus PD630]UDH01617.1 hypothetical protein K2Z90_008191 [Rhodococcus opacus PD630]